MENINELTNRINRLKTAKNAVILVHNYQRPEIYKVADFIGDSLELSRKASETKADIIVFCGVRFMAETAKILNPEKIVLLPKLEAGCSLADMVTARDVKNLRKKYPDAAVVSYINTNADVKAISDICCTSANAVKIINSLPNERIIFLPDKNLGTYIQTQTNKEMILWEGYCYVHDTLDKDALLDFKREHPNSKIIAHPECREDILGITDYVCGTGSMAKFAAADDSKDFIVVTECGMTNKLKEDLPDKNFYSFCNFCKFMKANDLNSVWESLVLNQYEINLDEEVMIDARKSLTKMLEVQ